jgi:hypothetical protein
VYDDKYPKKSITVLQAEVTEAYEELQRLRRSKISMGDWVQVYIADTQPFYGKIKNISGEFATLCGVFDHTNNQRYGFELINMKPIPAELSRLLESQYKK